MFNMAPMKNTHFAPGLPVTRAQVKIAFFNKQMTKLYPAKMKNLRISQGGTLLFIGKVLH